MMEVFNLYEATLRLGISYNELIRRIEKGDIPISRKVYTVTTRPPKPSDKISSSDIEAFENNHTFNRIHQPVEWNINAHGCHICISHPLDSEGYPILRINGKTQRITQYLYEMANKGKGGLALGLSVKHSCGNVKCIRLECIGVTMEKRSSKGTRTKKGNPLTTSANVNDDEHSIHLQIGFFSGRITSRHWTITPDQIKAILAAKYFGKSSTEIAKKYRTTPQIVARIWASGDHSTSSWS